MIRPEPPLASAMRGKLRNLVLRLQAARAFEVAPLPSLSAHHTQSLERVGFALEQAGRISLAFRLMSSFRIRPVFSQTLDLGLADVPDPSGLRIRNRQHGGNPMNILQDNLLKNDRNEEIDR